MVRRKPRTFGIALVLSALLIFGAVAFMRGLFSPYPVGLNIRQVGLDPSDVTGRAYYRWDNRVREPVRSYLDRKRRNAAHFTGSIILCRPGSSVDGVEMAAIDGKGSYESAPYSDAVLDDERLIQDFRTLGKSNLKSVLDNTRNDWRILNDNNHFIDPEAAFSGAIVVKSEGWIGWTTCLHVSADRIMRTERTLCVTLD